MAGGLTNKLAATWDALVGGVNAVAQVDELKADNEDLCAEVELLQAQLAEARWQRDLAEKSLAAARDEVTELRAQLDAERMWRAGVYGHAGQQVYAGKREVVP